MHGDALVSREEGVRSETPVFASIIRYKSAKSEHGSLNELPVWKTYRKGFRWDAYKHAHCAPANSQHVFNSALYYIRYVTVVCVPRPGRPRRTRLKDTNSVVKRRTHACEHRRISFGNFVERVAFDDTEKR